MRLHIANNEKIISRSIANFDAVFPADNKWIILPNSRKRDYIGDNRLVTKCDYDSVLFWDSIGDVQKYDKVIIHCLTEDKAKFVCKIEHPCLYWIEWGQDLYQALLECKGYKLYSERNTMWRLSNHKYIPLFLYELCRKYRLRKTASLYVAAAKKIKYFVPDSMYDEYPLLLRYYPELSHLVYKEFFYYPIDEVLDVNELQTDYLGPNIIVGHSASPSCNHVEVFKYLKSLDIKDRKIITPLSYNSKENAKYVGEAGRAILGTAFSPIYDYMTLSCYNDLLKSANTFIYNNYRQEAVGNILVALYLGGKVYMNKRNPLYHFYKNLGLVIFNIEELNKESISSSMSRDDVKNNRRILLDMYSKEKQLSFIYDNM